MVQRKEHLRMHSITHRYPKKSERLWGRVFLLDQDANKFQLFLFLLASCSYDRSKYVGRDEDDRNMKLIMLAY
jgi:hypothetical protein